MPFHSTARAASNRGSSRIALTEGATANRDASWIALIEGAAANRGSPEPASPREPRYNPCLMYTPSREEFVAAAARGNLIPVYRELLADGDTPVSAYAALGGGEHTFLLESVVGGETWAAYSFVGVAPRALVRWANNTATVTWFDVDAGGPPKTASWPMKYVRRS